MKHYHNIPLLDKGFDRVSRQEMAAIQSIADNHLYANAQF